MSADVVAGRQAGLRGGRTVASGDDAQVALARQIDADVAGRQRRAAFDLLHLVGGEERAVGIEAVGQPVHRARHHLVDVDFLHVVVRDQVHDIVEDLEVLVGVLARHRLVQKPAQRGRTRRSAPKSTARCGGYLEDIVYLSVSAIVRDRPGDRRREARNKVRLRSAGRRR